MILNSLRKSTFAQYCVYIKPWFEFSKQRLKPTVKNIIEFLTFLHSEGYTYGELCTARSALSLISDVPNVGKNPDLKRFMKGVFETAPVFPRVVSVWNVAYVFNFFRSLPHQKDLDIELCGKKLALLICILAGGQRSQTVHAIKATDIVVANEKCIIPIYDPLKQTRRGKHMKPLEFKVYLKEPKLCVIDNLSCYMAKTRHLRKSTPLFISYQKPYQPVSKDTIARWCKNMMARSGVNIEKYTTHSCRSAASSLAKSRNVALKKIMDSCGWSSERSFALHYDKYITSEETIGETLLK